MMTLRLATRGDDGVLREFLRGHGMAAWIEMALQREPSFFLGRDYSGEEWAVIAEEDSRIVGMYAAATRPVHLNGRADSVGYLFGLRVSAAYRHRIRYLRQGYASIGPLTPAGAGAAPLWWFTVVSTDNLAARQLLEAGVRGLPVYHPLGDYVTYALPTARGRHKGLWRRAEGDDVDRLVSFHNTQASRWNLTPVLDGASIRRIGTERFYIFERGGSVLGVAALWDQRAFKQIVAAHYRRPIGTLIPFYNLYAKLARRIPLPREGRALDHTFVSFLALRDEVRSESRAILRDLFSHCKTPIASLGVHTEHPLNAVLSSLKPMRYPARIYGVTFDGHAPSTQRPCQPEVALL